MLQGDTFHILHLEGQSLFCFLCFFVLVFFFFSCFLLLDPSDIFLELWRPDVQSCTYAGPRQGLCTCSLLIFSFVSQLSAYASGGLPEPLVLSSALSAFCGSFYTPATICHHLTRLLPCVTCPPFWNVSLPSAKMTSPSFTAVPSAPRNSA